MAQQIHLSRGQAPTHTQSASPISLHADRFLVCIGIVMLVLVGLYDELLPRLDGSADPAFVRTGPWAFDLPLPAFVTNSGGAPIFLSLVLLSAIATAYVVGLGVIHRLPGDRRTLLIVLGFSVLASVIMLVSPPSRNADLDYYAFEGRMIIRDGQNPYAVPARALADDAWFPALSPTWRALTTGYGPAWLAIASGVDVVTDHGGGLSDLARTLTGFRLLFVVLGSFNALFIWSILGIIAPERRLTGTIAYVWNPVVLLIGVEHNDTAMLFLALLGIWLEVHGRPALAIVALTLSALLKYLTGPLLIAYLVWRWRSAGRRHTLVLAILAAVTTGLVFLPFDPIVFLSHLPTYLHQSGRLDHIEQASFLLVAMVVIGSLIALSWPHQLNQVFSVATLVLFAYLAELSRDWFPWYVVSVLGISTLPGGWWLGAAATSGVTWILGLHQGTAYLAGLAQSSLGLAPSLTVALTFFGPAVLACLVGMTSYHPFWRARPLRGLAIGIGLIAMVAVALPILADWSSPPIVADLGGGLWPGPEIFGTALEWDDWSWNTHVTQIGTPIGPAGPRSLCLTFQSAGGAFYAHHPHFATGDYQALTFLLGPPGQSSPPLILSVRDTAGQTLGTVSLALYQSHAQYHDGWQEVKVPLSDLHAEETVVTGVLLQSASPPPTPTVCIQQLAFR